MLVCSFMYWSDWTFNSNTSGKIEKAYMDGTNRKALITEQLSYPNGLAIDSGFIYWCDSNYKRLERADLNGKNRMVGGGFAVHFCEHIDISILIRTCFS